MSQLGTIYQFVNWLEQVEQVGVKYSNAIKSTDTLSLRIPLQDRVSFNATSGNLDLIIYGQEQILIQTIPRV